MCCIVDLVPVRGAKHVLFAHFLCVNKLLLCAVSVLMRYL